MSARSATLSWVAPSPSGDREERGAPPPAPGYGRPPFFERNDNRHQSAAIPRSDAGAEERLGQIIHLAATGVWVIKRNGLLVEIGGRMHWESREALDAAAAGARVPVSSIAIRTDNIR